MGLVVTILCQQRTIHNTENFTNSVAVGFLEWFCAARACTNRRQVYVSDAQDDEIKTIIGGMFSILLCDSASRI